MTLPVSVFIIAHNEADRIHRPILSVRDWAAEVIVIDSGSDDDTKARAEALGARVIAHAWPGYGLQKRFGEDQCRHDWLLNLDADEEVTPELAGEIQALFSHGDPALKGYRLRVCDILPGENSAPWYCHVNHCLRLYDKRFGQFSDSPVHDSVIMREGEIGALKGAVLHRSFRSLSHAVEKANRYSDAQVLDLRARGKRFPAWRMYTEFPLAFFKIYCLRLYALRGARGFAFATVYAFARFLRVAKASLPREGEAGS